MLPSLFSFFDFFFCTKFNPVINLTVGQLKLTYNLHI